MPEAVCQTQAREAETFLWVQELMAARLVMRKCKSGPDLRVWHGDESKWPVPGKALSVHKDRLLSAPPVQEIAPSATLGGARPSARSKVGTESAGYEGPGELRKMYLGSHWN